MRREIHTLLASALCEKPCHLHRTSSLLLLSSRLPSVWKCFQTEDFGRPPLPVLPAVALGVPVPPPGVRAFAPTEPSRSCCGSCTPGCSYSVTCCLSSAGAWASTAAMSGRPRASFRGRLRDVQECWRAVMADLAKAWLLLEFGPVLTWQISNDGPRFLRSGHAEAQAVISRDESKLCALKV